MKSVRPPVICLLGPTASGKTDLAIEIVQRLPCEIVSVDSAQIYKEMDIGTGKPDAATLAKAPHHLIDFLDPAKTYSAAQFRHDALQEMEAICAAGKTPLLVGGTMLYFRALRDGLAKMPASNAQVREGILAKADREGWAAVHAQLAQVDPESAQRIHPNDPQRLQRALEVYLVSGKTMTAHHLQENAAQTAADLPFNLHFFAIQPQDRAVLHERIAMRFGRMIEQGLIAEVERLYARGDLDLSMPSMRAVGYRQTWRYIAGELRFDAMVEQGIIATRQLAKRQLTWMRSWENLRSFDSEDAKTLDLLLNSISRVAI